MDVNRGRPGHTSTVAPAARHRGAPCGTLVPQVSERMPRNGDPDMTGGRVARQQDDPACEGVVRPARYLSGDWSQSLGNGALRVLGRGEGFK